MGKLVVTGVQGGGGGGFCTTQVLTKMLTDLAVLLVLLQDFFSFTLDGVCYLMQKVGPVLTGEGLQAPGGIPGLDGQLSAAVWYLWRCLWVCIRHTNLTHVRLVSTPVYTTNTAASGTEAVRATILTPCSAHTFTYAQLQAHMSRGCHTGLHNSSSMLKINVPLSLRLHVCFKVRFSLISILALSCKVTRILVKTLQHSYGLSYKKRLQQTILNACSTSTGIACGRQLHVPRTKCNLRSHEPRAQRKNTTCHLPPSYLNAVTGQAQDNQQTMLAVQSLLLDYPVSVVNSQEQSCKGYLGFASPPPYAPACTGFPPDQTRCPQPVRTPTAAQTDTWSGPTDYSSAFPLSSLLTTVSQPGTHLICNESPRGRQLAACSTSAAMVSSECVMLRDIILQLPAVKVNDQVSTTPAFCHACTAAMHNAAKHPCSTS